MAVGDQDFVQTFKPKTRAHDLALSTLTTVDQKAVLVMQHNMGSEAAVYRGSRG